MHLATHVAPASSTTYELLYRQYAPRMFLDIPEAAQVLGMSRSTWQRREKEGPGRVPASRLIGGRRLVCLRDMAAWLDKQDAKEQNNSK